jgi:hypothetical protein
LIPLDSFPGDKAYRREAGEGRVASDCHGHGVLSPEREVFGVVDHTHPETVLAGLLAEAVTCILRADRTSVMDITISVNWRWRPLDAS